MGVNATDGGTEKSGPTYIVSPASAHCSEVSETGKRGLQKKWIVVGVSVVVVIGLVIAGNLVGVHMTAQAQKEVLQFALQFKSSLGQNTTQTVVSDPNANVVMFHVSANNQDAYVVNDFNKDIQVVKIVSPSGTNCYLSPLNISNAMNPSDIIGTSSMTGSNVGTQTMILSQTPLSDTSFLTPKAATMCAGVSVYWAYRHCPIALDNNNSSIVPSNDGSRHKRALYGPWAWNGLACVGGCCHSFCACQVQVVQYISGTSKTCNYYFQTGGCNSPIKNNAYITNTSPNYCN
jgi:hypothetical protein